MRDYTMTLSQMGEAVVEVKGNYFQLLEVGAPQERYRVTAENFQGHTVFSINMKQGGFIKNLPESFSRVRITNENQGATNITVVAGIGEYEESGGASSGGAATTELLAPILVVADTDDFIHHIPPNDSRKLLAIQTDEDNIDNVLLNGGYQLTPAMDWERPVKNGVTLTIKKAGDIAVYMEEV